MVGGPAIYGLQFCFYIFQQLNSWPKNGEADYTAKIAQMSPYLTPSCQDFLNKDAEMRKNNDELRDRVRVVYEIPVVVTATAA